MTTFAELPHLPDDNESMKKRDGRLFLQQVVEMVREELRDTVKKNEFISHRQEDKIEFGEVKVSVNEVKVEISGVEGDDNNRGVKGKLDDLIKLVQQPPSLKINSTNLKIAGAFLTPIALGIWWGGIFYSNEKMNEKNNADNAFKIEKLEMQQMNIDNRIDSLILINHGKY